MTMAVPPPRPEMPPTFQMAPGVNPDIDLPHQAAPPPSRACSPPRHLVMDQGLSAFLTHLTLHVSTAHVPGKSAVEDRT